MNIMDFKNFNIVHGKTIEEWFEKYKGNTLLHSFSTADVLNEKVKLDENICYWEIDGRLYETLEPRKKIPAKRPPMKKVSNNGVDKSDILEEIRQAELYNAMSILLDNGYVAVTREEYQTLKQAAEAKPKAKEERLYVIYEGEFGGYIARVCDDPNAPFSVTSLTKVQKQLAEDGYWVSKVCSSATDNEVFMICFKEGD